MAETTTTTDNGAEPASDGPSFLNGKYAGEGAEAKFAGGYNELRKKAGLDPIGDDASFIGDDGVFHSQAAAERAYNELRTITNRQQTPKPDNKGNGKPRSDRVTLGQDALADEQDGGDVFSRSGVELKTLVDGYRTTEKIDEKALAALEKAGLPRQVVTAQVEAIVERDTLRTDAFFTEAAIMANPALAEQLKAARQDVSRLIKDAAQYVPADEMADINERLNSPVHWKGAIRDLRAMRAAAIGDPTTGIVSGGAPTGGSAKAAETIDEFNELARKAHNGDKAAAARVAATRKTDQYKKWME